MAVAENGTRTRTVTWEDPLVGAQMARTMAGLDYMQAIADGKIPGAPLALLMGIKPAEFSEGRAVFVVEPAEYHYNPIGVVHGGLISTLCDSALGCAIHTALPAGTGYTTLELHVNFTRPLTRETGEVRCEANVLHVGKRMATAEAKVLDGDGRLYGHATTTCMVFPAEQP